MIDGGFFDQPLGFYVVGVPLLAMCAAGALVILTGAVAIVLAVLGLWLDAAVKVVEVIRGRS